MVEKYVHLTQILLSVIVQSLNLTTVFDTFFEILYVKININNGEKLYNYNYYGRISGSQKTYV